MSTAPAASTCRWCRAARLAAFALLLLAHAGLVLRNYPPHLLRAGAIPLRGDVSRYYATAAAAEQVGGLYGYDPYNMAGYPVGLWNSMGKKGFEILHLLTPGLGLPRLFYLTLVGLALLAPLALWLCLRPALASPRAAALLLVLTLACWHLSTDIAYFWYFGNIFFPAGACAIACMTAAAHAIVSGRRPFAAALALGLLAAALVYAHTVLVLAHGPARVRPRQWLAFALAAVLAAALTLPWLIPLWQSRADCLAQPKAWFQSGPKFLVMDLLSDRVYRQPFDRNFLFRAVAILGLAGTALAWRRQPLPAAVGLGGLAALAITYGGGFIDAMQSVQPYRFTIPATLLFLAPAAVALDYGWQALRDAPRAARTTLLVLLLLLAPQVTAYLIDLTWPRDPIGLNADQRAAIDWFNAHPPAGRVFCDDMELGHLLPALARVHILGGLSSQAFLKHRFAGVDDDLIAFGRPARDWAADALQTHFNTYGVEYALLASKPWLNASQRLASLFEPVTDLGGRRLFRIRNGDPDFVLEGSASVRVDYRGIHVSDLAASPLVLKFHYAPWLTAGPGVRLEPVPVLDDPIPFIRATSSPGQTAFTIHKP